MEFHKSVEKAVLIILRLQIHQKIDKSVDSHITSLPGIWCSVFTESPDVSDFFLPKIGQKCQIGDFWGYSGPNLATL